MEGNFLLDDIGRSRSEELVCMSESYLYIIVFEVYDRIQRVVGDFLVEQAL